MEEDGIRTGAKRDSESLASLSAGPVIVKFPLPSKTINKIHDVTCFRGSFLVRVEKKQSWDSYNLVLAEMSSSTTRQARAPCPSFRRQRFC